LSADTRAYRDSQVAQWREFNSLAVYDLCGENRFCEMELPTLQGAVPETYFSTEYEVKMVHTMFMIM